MFECRKFVSCRFDFLCPYKKFSPDANVIYFGVNGKVTREYYYNNVALDVFDYPTVVV